MAYAALGVLLRPSLIHFLPTVMDVLFPESLTSIEWQGTQSPS